MNNNEIPEVLLTNNRKKYIEDIISLLRSIDNLYSDFFGNQLNDVSENISELGVRLDTINRFGHCIMDEIVEDGY